MRLVTSAFVLIVSTVFVLGCSSKHKGAPVVTSAYGHHIDSSWMTALNACWPELAQQGYTADQLRRNLAQASSFRHAFPVYTAQPGDSIENLLGKPLQAAPPPDTSKLRQVDYPVLNRGQAAQGVGPKGAVVQSTDGIAPPDALCAVQPGVPQGFNR